MYLTSPVVAMWRTDWYQNLTTIQGQQEVRSFRFCMGSSSLVLSGVVFDHWSTHGYIRVLHRAFQVIELQACHRVFAPSRRAQDRERLLVLPRPSTLSHWPSPSSWSSWIFEGFPVHLSLSPFCSTCALIRSHRRIPGNRSQDWPVLSRTRLGDVFLNLRNGPTCHLFNKCVVAWAPEGSVSRCQQFRPHCVGQARQ